MGFGLSGDDGKTKMVGGDVTIAWMDHATGKEQVTDSVCIHVTFESTPCI